MEERIGSDRNLHSLKCSIAVLSPEVVFKSTNSPNEVCAEGTEAIDQCKEEHSEYCGVNERTKE